MTGAKIRLANVYSNEQAPLVLFRLLKEREKRANISHRRMPSMAEHLKFVSSKPYKTWDLILCGAETLGAVYLSRQDEIGLFIFKKYRGRGYGKEALKLLMKKHAGVKRFLANISPKNRNSIHFFEQSGFRHIQNTYELRGKL